MNYLLKYHSSIEPSHIVRMPVRHLGGTSYETDTTARLVFRVKAGRVYLVASHAVWDGTTNRWITGNIRWCALRLVGWLVKEKRS